MDTADSHSSRAQLAAAGELDVLIVGPYPPPLGGVSTHVKRLSEALGKRGLRVGVLNHFGHKEGPVVIGALHRNPVLYWLTLRRLVAPVVHYHHGRLSTLVAVALARREKGASYVATIHGHGLSRYLRIPILSRLTRWALCRFDEIVAVSPEIARSITSTLNQQPVTVLPAYVPSGDVRYGALPENVHEFLHQRGRTLIVSAYRVKRAGRTGDIYGLDLVIDAFLRIARSHPDLRLAIFLARGAKGRWAKRYLNALMDRVEKAGTADRATLYVGLDLVPAFTHDVIYLRPSRTDGDAVSIREALDAGTPVIASDVVQRPAGTQVIRDGDIAAWCTAIERALQRPAAQLPADGKSEAGPGVQARDGYVGATLDFYARLLPAEVLVRLEGDRDGAPSVSHSTRQRSSG